MNVKLRVEIETTGTVVSHSIEQDRDKSLLDILNELKVSIDQSCGGNGTCGTCLYRVIEGFQFISDRETLESEMAADRGFAENERLACQSQISGSIRIRL